MSEAWGTLHVEVRGGEIIVTLPATIYTATYHKPANSPQLLARTFTRKDDRPRATHCRGISGPRMASRQCQSA